MATVGDTVKRLLRDTPAHVTIMAAAKGAAPEQVREAVEAGIGVIGQNYFSEARRVRPHVPLPAEWHFIGRLRPHDIRVGNLRLFEAIQSIDSLDLARRVDAKCAAMDRAMPVFVEVNSGREPQKAGVYPEAAEALVREIATLSHVRVVGLMTMGPIGDSPNSYRPFFAETRQLYSHIRRLGIPGVTMRHLSMGTSESYETAIEEGATMVRLGATLFGTHHG